MKKYITITLITLSVISILIYLVNDANNNARLANELNDVINTIVEDAKKDSSIPKSIIKDNELIHIEDDFFRKFGSELDWVKFKQFIINGDYNWYKLSIPKHINKEDNNHTNVAIHFYYDDRVSFNSDIITFSAERIEGTWRILGILKGTSTVDVYKD